MDIQGIRDGMVKTMGLDADDTTVLDVILECIKDGIRMFATFIKSRRLITTATLSLSQGAQYVSLPSAFLTERKVYYKNSDGSRQPINPAHTDNYNEYNTTIIGVPEEYWIIAGVIYFDKTAQEAISIYVEHFKDESDIELTDTFFGNASELNILKDLAKFIYYSEYDDDPEKAGVKLALAKAGIEKINADYGRTEKQTHVEES